MYTSIASMLIRYADAFRRVPIRFSARSCATTTGARCEPPRTVRAACRHTPDDRAFLLQALIILHEATFDPRS